MTMPLDSEEDRRLAALARYEVLDTAPEAAFDAIVGITAQLLEAPVALISLVDAERIWFKARVGCEVPQIARDPGLCASAILASAVHVVRDASSDPVTCRHPLVTDGFGLRFYAGAPLRTPEGLRIGTLCVIDTRPRDLAAAQVELLDRLAALVVLQLEMRLTARTSEARLAESEERFRDLFDEAPIAYVHEGLDTRFIRANRTALRILGIAPDEVEGTYGKDLVPDTPRAQQRVQQALESIGRGADTSGVVLELRRKDDARPVFIQWWSRPDPSGRFTRTMFLDITEAVQMSEEKLRLEAQNAYLREEIRAEHGFDEIVGASASLVELLRQVDQVAPTGSTVLLTGETGTGKELIARALHERSPRRGRALVKVNCGAISAGLVESELFGHVKGAFTGALGARDGRFKLADGGTLFLDEVGELPLDTQVKLLRVLQEQEFEPIGGNHTVPVDVRIVAATNRDLAQAVKDGRFRSDLFYRLAVVPMHVPSLRERGADIPMLAAFFLQRCARKLGKPEPRISAEVMERLVRYPWPGNVRELQNVIERAVVLSRKPELELADFLAPLVAPLASSPVAPEGAPPSPPPATPRSSLDEALRQHIEAVLAETGGMVEGAGGAAERLGLHPSTLRSKMKKLGVRRPARS
ncbi:MAG: sigma 54-interacting transcriptional regulator [Deltaproteobacteria bacterium]|nr:sigma 54-interacting transcriptional regulator [Deltaproteobacteria bacterium]